MYGLIYKIHIYTGISETGGILKLSVTDKVLQVYKG